jgi:DNA helicase-2/ATP-dependent DNA helicase PcrA
VAAYLKLVHNPRDEISFKRLVRLMPGVGGKSADKLWQKFSGEFGVLIFASRTTGAQLETPNSKPETSSLAVALARISASVPKKAAAAWAQFTATLAQLCAPEICTKPDAMIRLVLEAGYEDHLKATYPNFRNRLEDLEQLASFARQFPTMADFLTQLALLTNVEAEDNQPSADDHEKIRLSSIHQAKGLEFRVVFVIMLCDGLFPSARSVENPEGEEEERRLFYVAVTRAKDELYLTHPLMRFMAGGGDAMQQPSRFLADVPPELREEWNLRPPVPATDFSDYRDYDSSREGSEDSPF